MSLRDAERALNAVGSILDRCRAVEEAWRACDAAEAAGENADRVSAVRRRIVVRILKRLMPDAYAYAQRESGESRRCWLAVTLALADGVHRWIAATDRRIVFEGVEMDLDAFDELMRVRGNTDRVRAIFHGESSS